MRSSLLALCMVLAGVMALQQQRTEQRSAPAVAPVPGPHASVETATLADSSFAFAALERYGAIVERPVFYPSRRPPREQGKGKTADPGQRELLLAGVLIMSDRKLALLQQPGSPDIIRLRPGGELYDWVLMDVSEDRVTMRRGTELRELRLRR